MGLTRREDLLAELLEGAAERGHESRFVLVAGDRGVGKTFVGQELYRELAALQEPPGFWPAEILDADGRGLERDRHAVRPERFAIPRDAKPTYAWIGINCQRAVDGVAYNALGAASVQVKRLRSAIEATLRSGHAGRSRAILFDLLEVATAFGSLTQDPTIAALGLALTARSAADAFRSVSASRAEREDVRGEPDGGLEIDLTVPDRATVASYRELLTALTERIGLPTVLFIDDLQHADPTLLRLLEELPAALPRNLTVLCAAERGVLDAQAETSRDERPGAWLAGARSPAFTRAELELLDEGTLAEIVRIHAPHTDRATVAALVNRSEGNPYRLHLLLDSPRAQPREGAIELDPREVTGFPDRIENLYRQAWAFLPAATRQIVALAAIQGRAVSDTLLRGACDHLGISQPDDRIVKAQREQWLIPVADGVLAFPDDARHAVARTEAFADDTLAAEQRERAGTLALALATRALNGPLAAWADEQAHAAEMPATVLPHLEAVATLGALYPSDAPDDVARLTFAYGDILSRRGEVRQAAASLAAVGERLRTHEPEHRRTGAHMEIRAAEWWSDDGQSQEALSRLERLERACPDLLAEPELGRYLTFVKGRTLGRDGRPDLALPLLMEVAHDSTGGEDPLRLRSSQVGVEMAVDVGAVNVGAGEYLRQTGEILIESNDVSWWKDAECCEPLRALIRQHRLRRVNAGRTALHGPTGFFGRQLGNKADVCRGMGLWIAALDMHDDIAEGLVAVAPHHANTITVISERGTLLSMLRRLDDALREQERAIELHRRFSRDTSPNLIVSLGNRAQTLSRMGRHEEAIRELETIRDEGLRLLDSGHPAVLHTRMGMARALARAGDRDRAVAAYRETVNAFATALGPEHPETQQYATTLQAVDQDLLSIETIGSDERSDGLIALDVWRAEFYRRAQAEDWALLFGTATSRLRLKRVAQERLLMLGARLLLR